MVIEDGDSRLTVASKIGEALNWQENLKNRLIFVLRSIQWDSFKAVLTEYLSEEFNWTEEEKNLFLTHSEEILGIENDILSQVFVAGDYLFEEETSPAFIAEILVDRVYEEHSNPKEFLVNYIDQEKKELVRNFVESRLELLPDLLPLPPQDMALRTDEYGRTLLVFTTTYYNKGPGKLELVAEQNTAGVSEDVERKVFQHIYRTDGTYRTKFAGEFLWHEEHLHYHFSDFVKYVLEPFNDTGDLEESISSRNLQDKATFCVRDTTVMKMDIEVGEAEFKVCGKERQGISVGWGDSYFHTYASQSFDVTSIPSGIYKLSFFVNPLSLFEEASENNNSSHAVIKINKVSGRVETISVIPAIFPEFDHVNLDLD